MSNTVRSEELDSKTQLVRNLGLGKLEHISFVKILFQSIYY